MPQKPYKLRLRRVRANVLIDYLEPVGRAGWAALETVNLGPLTLRDAVESLKETDLSKAPRLKSVLFPTITVNEP